MLAINDLQKSFRVPGTGQSRRIVDVPAFALAAGEHVALRGEPACNYR